MIIRQWLRSGLRNGILLSIALVLALATAAHAQSGIDTITGWDGSSFVGSFGVIDTATYGQTITVPSGATPLTSFTFEIGYCGASVTMRGSVYAWNGTRATGATLFTSAPVTILNSNSYQQVTFTIPGGIALPAGQYVLFASTSQDQTGAPYSACRWGAFDLEAMNNNPYPGGQFYYEKNATDISQWTGTAWDTRNQDLAFRTNGGVAPPSLGTSFGAAGIGVGGSTSLSFTISNANLGTALSGVGFSDILPAGLTVATPNGLTGSCGGGTITATAGSGSVSLTGATLAASASCTFSVNVTGTTSGAKNNTAGPVTSNEAGTGNTASATVTVQAAQTAAGVPAVSATALGALAVLLAGLGWLLARRAQTQG